MNPNPSSGQTSRSTSGHLEPEHVGPDPLNEDMTRLQREVASLKDTFARLASQVSSEAAKTVRNVGQTVASQAGGVADAGSELASSAKEHAKTVVSELEAMARRNPLGTIAGAVLVGVIIGMISMSRGRG